MFGLGLAAAIAAVAGLSGLGVLRWFIKNYHKIPPNKAMVIYGKNFSKDDPVKLVTGGGAFVSPILQAFDVLDLTIMTISKDRDELYTVDGVPILLDWVAQVQVAPDQEGLMTAARAFLSRSREEVQKVITDTLSANFRAIVGQLSVEEIHRDRDAFVQQVSSQASDDMHAMGVRVISMGIQEITDEQGYFEALATPQIAAVKRDARIAQAEADREARVKAAAALQQARQAELHSDREILEQQEALELREVRMKQQVGLAQAEADREVNEQRATAIEREQEANVLVPARAQREARKIEVETESRRIRVTAEASANAELIQAQARAEATEKTGKAEAGALLARQLAEAEGKTKLAAAIAAADEITLRQFVVETLAMADVAKAEAMAGALAGIGEKVRIVQFSGDNGGQTGNTLLDMLMTIPEVATTLSAKIEALSGDDLETNITRAVRLLQDLTLPDAGNGHNGANENSHELEEVDTPAEELTEA